MRKNSCLPRRGASLCAECGTNINTENVDFSRQEKNLVYLDKIYSYNQATSCPLLSAFCSNPGNAVTELTLEPINRPDRCDCGGRGCIRCCSHDRITLDEDAVFTIDESYVLVESFTLANPTSLTPDQITVDGVYIDGLSFHNGQFSAPTNNLLPQILKDRCQDLYLPTKAFFLITEAGPWMYRATFVLKGTVNCNGRTSCFKAEIKTSDCTPRCVNGASNFAIPNISLPCSINGTAPMINFQFTGAVSMLNPELSFACNNRSCGLVLETNLVVEPMVNVEVVRKTLFCVDACEAMIPCDGTEQQYDSMMDEECEFPPPPACGCGTAPLIAPESRERLPLCDFDDDDRGSCGCTHTRATQYGGCNGFSW